MTGITFVTASEGRLTMAFSFTIARKHNNGMGRAGVLLTPHGVIETPAFVPVGTKGTVKSLSPEDVRAAGADVVLANTYHLYIEPGHEVIKKAGGLHRFMNWNGPLMTDSGGYQVFSLGAGIEDGISPSGTYKKRKDDDASGRHARLASVDEDGVTFRSHLNGTEHRFTPERSIEIQHGIGADMIFAFDECTAENATPEYQKEATERTHRWAKRCLEYHAAHGSLDTQMLFGIVQGGKSRALREESAHTISSLGFPAFGVGSSSIGADLEKNLLWSVPFLPEEKPRHILGVGEPKDLFTAVERGGDLFDCVAPTRMARNGTLHTTRGKISVINARFREDFSPIDADCGCSTCAHYTKAYLSHLLRSGEMFGATLASIHNVFFITHLVRAMRQSLMNGGFETFKKAFLSAYYGTV